MSQQGTSVYSTTQASIAQIDNSTLLQTGQPDIEQIAAIESAQHTNIQEHVMSDPKDIQDNKGNEIEDGELADDQLDGVSGGGVFAKLGDFKRPLRNTHNSIPDQAKRDSFDS